MEYTYYMNYTYNYSYVCYINLNPKRTDTLELE